MDEQDIQDKTGTMSRLILYILFIHVQFFFRKINASQAN
jgi:hypothetical protein